MLLNVELKDYPAHSGDFAYASADKAIAMLEAEGLLPQCTINTWSGELNEYLKAKYGDKVMIHAYFPQTLMGLNQKRFVLDYAYCVCQRARVRAEAFRCGKELRRGALGLLEAGGRRALRSGHRVWREADYCQRSPVGAGLSAPQGAA